MNYDCDLFTIGAGSGGVRASRMSAAYGARVIVAEDAALGGTCVNVGCIPKKLMVYASHFREEFEDAAGYGWTVGERSFDWRRFRERKDGEIARLNGVYQRILEHNGVEIVRERATIVDPHTVRVGTRTVTARYILVATGGWPTMPHDVPGIEHAISSNEIFHLDEAPGRTVIMGGGYIATEFACILHGMGFDVVQVYWKDLFLRGFDRDVRTTLAEEMRKKGIDLRFGAEVVRIEREAGGPLRATLNDGETLEADQVLCATGRRPQTKGLGLESAGVECKPGGAIAVDDYSCTSVPSIYAIGDVTNRINLTPVAIHEGMAVAATLFDGRPTRMDYAYVPSAVFSQPTIGTVGLSEEQARERYGEVHVYRTSFKPLKHTLTGRNESTMMKIVVERATDRVVGCHMVGPDAGEIVQGLAIALKCGATKAQFDTTIGIHPTAAEEFVTMRQPVESLS